MPRLPVRIELKCEPGNIFCRFTIADISFVISPVRGDPVEFFYDGWPERVLTFVQYIHHLIGTTSGSIVCCSVTLAEQAQLVAVFDRFKDSVAILDVDTGGTRPPPYYPAYRLVYRLWGQKAFVHGTDHPSVVAELIRAVVVASAIDIEARALNRAIELVHKLIIEHKQHKHTEVFDLLDLMRAWDDGTGLCHRIGAVDEVLAAEIAKSLFAAIKSVPADKLPICVGRHSA